VFVVGVLRRVGGLPVVTGAALVTTTAAPLISRRPTPLVVLLVAAVGAVIAGVVGVVRLVRSRGRPLSTRSFTPAVRDMLLHLSPVLLLTVIFPVVSRRIAHAQVAGVGLTSLLLASSLTVPWLSQAVCLPLYRAIGHLIAEGDMARIQRRFCEVWPLTFVQSLPAIAVFAVPVEIAMGWPPTAFGTYLTLCALHLAFVQSLVLVNVGRKRVQWALAWTGYSAALFVAPTAWYLPPLVGLVTQLVPLRRQLRAARRPVMLANTDVAVDLVRGTLLGAVLWSDKLFFFLKAGSHFAVTAVFLALLPAVLAYNYYFVRLAPVFDRSVGDLRVAMEKEPYRALTVRSRALVAVVETSISRTAFAGALLGLVVTYLTAEVRPGSLPLIAAVAVGSWLFMMITVLCYKLDYIGQSGQAQVLSACHLVGCTLAFLVLPAGASLYVALIVFDVLLFAVALHRCLLHWRLSEYTLFWRHATAW